jgi:spore germination protein GerM
MRGKRQNKGRARLAALGGLITLTVAAAAVAVSWADNSVEAYERPYVSTEQTETTPDSSTQDEQGVAPGTDTGFSSDAPLDTSAPEPTAADLSRAVPAPAGTAEQIKTAKSTSAKVKVYFVQGEKLASVTKEIAATPLVGTAAVKLLLQGPSSIEKAAGFTSEIPETTAFRNLSISNGLATVDLGSGFCTGGGTASMYLRLGQLIYTLTEFPTVDRVKIRIDGTDLRSLGGEGLLIGSALDRAGYRKLIAGSSASDSGGSAPKVSSFKVYFVKQDKLTAYSRTIPFTPTVGKAAVQSLLAGPASADKAQGAGTAVPTGVKINSLTIKDRVAIVDLSGTFGSGGGSQSMYLRLGQVVYTLTEFPTVDRVQLKMDGKTVTTLGGEGLLIERPLSRADWAQIIQ